MAITTASPKRALGRDMTTALVIGNVIGAAVFLLPASLTAYGVIPVTMTGRRVGQER